jgi:hypothetical protein
MFGFQNQSDGISAVRYGVSYRPTRPAATSGALRSAGLMQLGFLQPSRIINDPIHQLDRFQGLDIILHTPGGDSAATESLVDYLRRVFPSDLLTWN